MTTRGHDRTTPHSTLVREIRLALGGPDCDDLALWPSPNGDAMRWDMRTSRVTHSHLGLPVGVGDLVGIMWPSGRWVELEVKTGGARQTEEQRTRATLIRRMGGFYAVVRSVDDARGAVVRARRGDRE